MKFCVKCSTTQSESDFSKCSSNKDGLQAYCKACNLSYRKKNKERIKDRKAREYLQNRDGILERVKLRAMGLRDAKAEYDRIYRQKHKNEYNLYRSKYDRSRMATDCLYKLIRILRNQTKQIFKNKSKPAHTQELLGCTFEEAQVYFTSLFYDRANGEPMTWDKLGEGGWHIDHIVPLSSGKTEEELRKLCHISNLQPLWEEDNLEKSDRLDWMHPTRRNKPSLETVSVLQ